MQVDMDLFWRKLEQLGDMDALALATACGEEVTVRPIAALVYGQELLFRTDEDSRKALHLKKNPNAAISLGLEFYLEGRARFIGRCTDSDNPEVQRAREVYTARWPNAFGEGDSYLSGKEVFIAIKPLRVSQWVFNGDEPAGLVHQTL